MVAKVIQNSHKIGTETATQQPLSVFELTKTHTDYQVLNANIMHLHSFCSAFGIQRKEKESIYTPIYSLSFVYGCWGESCAFLIYISLKCILGVGDRAPHKNTLS
nr:MAG TPA: hypothetical protein [Caudoviricetes sp.]